MDLFSFLTSALIGGVAYDIAKNGANSLPDISNTIIEWAKANPEYDESFINSLKKNEIKEFLTYNDSMLNKVLAQLKTTERKGIAIVGPSGAGKTTLINYLINNHSGGAVNLSTPERCKHTARFNNRCVIVVDTPGSPFHVNLRKETYEFIKKSKLKCLIFVFSYGYLKTVGLNELRRPGQGQSDTFTNHKDYIKKCLSEEYDWISSFKEEVKTVKNTIPHIMVVINKFDHWYNKREEVLRHYKSGNFGNAIQEIVDNLCSPDSVPSYSLISCSYDSFYGKSPLGDISRESSNISIALLRAEITRRLQA